MWRNISTTSDIEKRKAGGINRNEAHRQHRGRNNGAAKEIYVTLAPSGFRTINISNVSMWVEDGVMAKGENKI